MRCRPKALPSPRRPPSYVVGRLRALGQSAVATVGSISVLPAWSKAVWQKHSRAARVRPANLPRPSGDSLGCGDAPGVGSTVTAGRRAGLVAAVLAVCIAIAVALASRPPYSVRQFERAVTLLERGEYEPAKDCLNEALRANPDYEDALAARANLCMATKDYALALEDLRAQYRLSSSGKSRAEMAYCLARLKHHAVAIEYYRQALDQGYDSPAVREQHGVQLPAIGAVAGSRGVL